MLLTEILQLIQEVAVKDGIATPWICGGIPRSKVLGTKRNDEISDLDLTTGDKSISYLATSVAIALRKHMVVAKKQAKDGHYTLYTKYIKIDFSTNFVVPGIENILTNMGVKQQTDLVKEMFSRDFTVNALLMSLDLKTIKDVTGQGVKDIENRLLKCCLTPEITFASSPNRIARIMYLAAKLDLDVDPAIISWVKNNPEFLLKSEPSYNSQKIEKGLHYDPAKTVSLINQMGLWPYINITENLKPYYYQSIKNKGT